VSVIDPLAGRPALVGSTWVRRTPEGDDWDGPVRIVGVFDTGNDANGLELVVQTVAFTGQPTLTADAASFAAHYKRVEVDDPAEKLHETLRTLEART
jgi:hypothetical protein